MKYVKGEKYLSGYVLLTETSMNHTVIENFVRKYGLFNSIEINNELLDFINNYSNLEFFLKHRFIKKVEDKPKFKIGDKVKILSKSVGKEIERTNIKLGNIYEIARTGPSFLTTNEGWFFLPEDVEKVIDEPTYKIGDNFSLGSITYKLCHIGNRHVMLFNTNGRFWSESIKVCNLNKITREEFTKICGPDRINSFIKKEKNEQFIKTTI